MLSLREAAKEKRRCKIVEAARELMKESGDAAFSMRSLAKRARVSLATPYNLFGSKQDIMFAVMNDDLEAFQRDLGKLHTDAIEAFFRVVTLARTWYEAEPEFHRAVLFAVYNDGGQRARAIFGGPRHMMWKDLIRAAESRGCLRSDLDADAFAINLGHIFLSCVLEWVNRQLTLEEFEARVHYGFALALAGMASRTSRQRLHERVSQAQTTLQRIWHRHLRRAVREGTLPEEMKEVLADQLAQMATPLPSEKAG